MPDRLRSGIRSLPPAETLGAPTAALLGVTDEAAAVLAELGIITVFDLGASSLFAAARHVRDAAATFASVDDIILPGDLVATERGGPVVDAAKLPIEALRLLSASQAAALRTALGVETIRDLAGWPPASSARALVAQAGDACGAQPVDDAEELRPRHGEFPTERVYYNSIVLLDHVGGDDSAATTPLTRPISASALARSPAPLRPALGSYLTISQSWYAQGVALGQMVHRLPLAPGENTRIAVVDWTRRTRSLTSETTEQDEQLTTEADHARALDEVQRAVAIETQRAGARARTDASSSAFGISASISARYLFASASLGASYSTAESESSSASSSFSSGMRRAGSEVTQLVADRTEQEALLVRSRRASAVREISQSEHESVSTRVVANYNHMHALTIQYYEVLQAYRVVTQLHRHERCIFVPFHLLDFSDRATRDRHRSALLRAALNPGVKQLLERTDNMVVLKTGSAAAAAAALAEVPQDPISPAGVYSRASIAGWMRSVANNAVRTLRGADAAVKGQVGAGNRQVISDGNPRLPATAVLESIVFTANVPYPMWDVTIHHRDGTAEPLPRMFFWDLRSLLRRPRLGELSRITMSIPFSGRVLLQLSHEGAGIAIDLDIAVATAGGVVVWFEDSGADREAVLVDHLQTHAAHYTRAVIASLDSSLILSMLAELEWNQRSLLAQVAPRPIAVTGQYMIFRAPSDDDERYDDLAHRHFGNLEPVTRVVPLPTGGVFAEAVLGRSNSAEKLELTRFWNWQDSPIPLTAPQIAELGLASRADAESLRASAPGAPMLAALAPAALPDPTTMPSLLQTVAAANLFRDMSGGAGNIQLAQAALQAAAVAATAAGTQAGQALAGEQQQQVSLARIAAGERSTAMGTQLSVARLAAAQGDKVNGSITADGARLRAAQQLDAAAASASPPRPVGTAVVPGAAPAPASASPAGTTAPRGFETTALLRSAFGAGALDGGGGGSPVAGERLGVVAMPASAPPGDVTGELVPRALQIRFSSGAEINAFFKAEKGAEFIPWFNGAVAGRGPWIGRALGTTVAAATNFVRIWDEIPAIFDEPSIDLLRFVALMSIFVNEVGGTLAPASEAVGLPGHPGIAYAFDAITGLKRSYNTLAGNLSAYDAFHDPDYLATHGAKALGAELARTSDGRWKGTSYPLEVSTSTDPVETGFVLEADFYKFRGRGLIQTTGRSGYRRLVELVQTYGGTQPVMKKFRAAWGTGSPDTICTTSTNQDWDELFNGTDLVLACLAIRAHNAMSRNYLALSGDVDVVNGTGPGSFYNMGLRISGGASYAALFKARVVALAMEIDR